MKQTKLLVALCLTGAALVGCQTTNNGGEDVESPKETALKAAMAAYVDGTVVPTYSALSDATTALYSQCELMMAHFDAGTLTDADVRAAADEWEKARKYWERARRSSSVPQRTTTSTRTSTHGPWIKTAWTPCSATPHRWRR